MGATRDPRIDILRFFGLSLLILAHIGAPSIMHELRTFDVPLMVFVSGLAAMSSTGAYKMWHRTKRLVLPVWIFLIGFFLVSWVCHYLSAGDSQWDWSVVWSSFIFYKGIGFVWIIRVFLLVMLVSPLLRMVNESVRSQWEFLVLVLFGVIVQSVLFRISGVMPNGLFSIIFVDYFLYLLGYSIILLVGMRVRYECSNKSFLVFAVIVVLLVWCMLFSFGPHHFCINSYKYPPQTVYILYGVSCSLLLWHLVSVTSLKFPPFLLWIGRNTIWLYLWHIPMVRLFNDMIGNWVLRYFCVYLGTLLIYGIQYQVVSRCRNSLLKRYLLG